MKLFLRLFLCALGITSPARYCTANSELSEIKQRLAALEAENASLKSAPPKAGGLPKLPSDAELFAKAAGVELSDVQWRMRAGLSARLAVQAASNQKSHNDKKAKETA